MLQRESGCSSSTRSGGAWTQPRANSLHTGFHRGICTTPTSRRPNIYSLAVGTTSGGFKDDDRDEDYPFELPTRFELMQRPDKQKPLVRVRLSVHYRVHSRQILCIGGSQIPLGWSFLSIAKVPMTWNSGDIWTCEVGGHLAIYSISPSSPPTQISPLTTDRTTGRAEN